jgi:cellulose synthase/poly-beta-1,6-N-acetylglucosamine synthase-like glycosyltransferase
MTGGKVAVSVIIPVAPGCSPRSAVRALEREAFGAGTIELITITGRHPSLQRNLAAARARGEWLYFLDHDSIVRPGTLRALLAAAKKFNADAAGGPNVGSPSKRLIDGAAEFVLKSPVGSPFIYRRYRSMDAEPRKATELSLILCNLLFRRDTFMRIKGFDPRLYPNEENELLNRLADEGGHAISVPRAAVEKSRHYTLGGYIRENFRYGRGRMQQIWVNPHAGDGPFIAIAAVAILVLAGLVIRPAEYSALGRWPKMLYFAVVIITGVRASLARGRFGGVWFGVIAANLLLLRHASYASGLVWGALTGWRARKIRHRAMPVTLDTRVLPGGRSVKKTLCTGLTPASGAVRR